MKKCSNCGSELDDNATFCPFCGARQDGKITCVNCGKAIDANSKYCPFCGKDPKIKSNNAGYQNTYSSPSYQYQSNSNEVLHGTGIGVLITFFLSIVGFVICYCLGDYECKQGAKIMLIIDIVISAIIGIIYAIIVATAVNAAY